MIKIRKVSLVGLIAFAIALCTLPLLGTPVYGAAGSVVNESTGVTYTSLAAAFDDVAAGDSAVLVAEGDFSEDVVLNKNADITLKKGSDACNVNGSFTANSGNLVLDGLNINGRVSYSGSGVTGSVKDCNIVTTGTGVSVASGATLSEITNTNITTTSYGIRMSAVSNSTIGIEKISGCNITTTSTGSISSKSTAAICLDGGWGVDNSNLYIGTIENCHLVCNGRYLEDAGIQIFRTAEVSTQKLYIDNVIGTEIDCYNGASGTFIHEAKVGNIIGVNIHCNISDLGKTRHSNGIYSYRSRIDLIEDTNILVEEENGSGIYCQSGSGVSTGIGAIRRTTVEAGAHGLNNAGPIGDISDSTFKSHQTGTGIGSSYQFSSIRMSSGRIGDMTNVTLEAGAFGMYISSNVTIGDIKDSSITAGYKGIYMYGSRPNYPSEIGDIINTKIATKDANPIHNYNASIGSISDCTIETQGSSGNGIAIYNHGYADIKDIKDSSIKGYAGIYCYGNSSAGKNTVGSICGNTIEASGVGIQVAGASVTEIGDNIIISGGNGIVLSNYKITSGTVDNNGEIDRIKGGSITATNYGIRVGADSSVETIDGVVIRSGATGVEARDAGAVSLVSNCSITTGTYGVDVKERSKIGRLSGNIVDATEDDAYEAIIIRRGGVIDEITDGTYKGKTNGVNLQGELGTISDGIFYGETGYAIQNSSEDGPVKIEPNLSTELKGNARYYGGRGTVANASLDEYPIYSPKNIKYSMSTFTETVTGISEAGFHYLTVNIEVRYEKNGGTGSMEGYAGEYRDDLTAEENAFTRKNHIFTGWNTKADGTGTAYQPGDPVKITEAKTTLYAQWEFRGSIQVSFGILDPKYKIEGVPIRDIQPPYHYAVSWFLQPYYGGGAATLKDSTGAKVGSFTNEYTYTFDNLKPGEYDIVLDVLNQDYICLNAGVHNGAPRSDIIIWSEDSDLLHVTVTGNETDVIPRWVSLERKAYGFKTVTDVGTFTANPQDSKIPGAPASGGKEYVYYAAYEGGNNWSYDNPEIDEKPYIPYVQTHCGIYHGESASKYSGMSGLQVPTLSAEEEAMGYVFKGWKLQGDDSGKVYSESEALAYMVTKHVAFEALWEKTKVKVSFDSNGGSKVPAQYIPTNTKATKPEDPTRDGYTFKGWYLDDEEFDFDTLVKEDITLKARWEEVPEPAEYTITYKLNGGEYNGSKEDITETYEAGTKITIHAKPTRAGYTFLYWEGSEYQPGDEYTVTEDHTFTAQWKAVDPTEPTDPDDPTGPTDPVDPNGPTDPVDPAGPTDSGDASGKRASHTGDDNDLTALLALLFASAGTITAIGYRRRNKRAQS